MLAVLADEASPDLAPLRTVDGQLGLDGLAASVYDELEAKMRALVSDLAERLAGTAEGESEKYAVKAAWVSEPTLSRGYGDLERSERDLARRAGLLAEWARRQVGKRGGVRPSPVTAAGGRGEGEQPTAATAGTMLYKAERTPNAGRGPTGGQLALAKLRQPGRSEAEIVEARRQVSALVDHGRPVPADLLVKGGFPAGLVKWAEAREQATRFEVLAKAATDRAIREGYEQLAAEAHEQAESGG